MYAACVCVHVHCLYKCVSQREWKTGLWWCGTVCVCEIHPSSTWVLIQLRGFGQRHFTEHNSALQSHQNSARHTFRALEVPQRQTRWSKHFHLNNGCSNLNDLTGTSSLLTDASYYKEFVIHIWAELRLYQIQEHNPFHSFAPLGVYFKPHFKFGAREGTNNTTDARTKQLLLGFCHLLNKNTIMA